MDIVLITLPFTFPLVAIHTNISTAKNYAESVFKYRDVSDYLIQIAKTTKDPTITSTTAKVIPELSQELKDGIVEDAKKSPEIFKILEPYERIVVQQIYISTYLTDRHADSILRTLKKSIFCKKLIFSKFSIFIN